MTITDFLAPNPGDCASALGLDVAIDVGLRTPIVIRTGYYGRLNEVRRELMVLMQTGEGSVQFESEYLSWIIEKWPYGSGDELHVRGVASSGYYTQISEGGLSQKTLSRVVHSDWRLQFEMLTSRIAESWLTDLRQQLDEAVAIFGYH